MKSSSQVAMVLVGNKCDMEMDREVSKEQVIPSRDIVNCTLYIVHYDVLIILAFNP